MDHVRRTTNVSMCVCACARHAIVDYLVTSNKKSNAMETAISTKTCNIVSFHICFVKLTVRVLFYGSMVGEGGITCSMLVCVSLRCENNQHFNVTRANDIYEEA